MVSNHNKHVNSRQLNWHYGGRWPKRHWWWTRLILEAQRPRDGTKTLWVGGFRWTEMIKNVRCGKTGTRQKEQRIRNDLLTRAKKFVWQSSKLAPLVWWLEWVIFHWTFRPVRRRRRLGRHTNTTEEAPADRGYHDHDDAAVHAKQFRPNDGRTSIMRTDIITGRKRDNHYPMRPELRCSCSSTASRVKWRTHQHTHSRTHARTHKTKDPRTRLAQHPSHG